MVFSPDSRSFAYAAMKSGQWYVVVDGKPGRPVIAAMKGTIVFSPDSLHIAYKAVVEKSGRQMVILDEEDGIICDWLGLNGPTFRDGGMLEYTGFTGGQLWHIKHVPVSNYK